jgi:starch synthase
VPVVRRVEGLADTVRPVVPGGDDDGTGFVFPDYTPEALLEAIRLALGVFRDRGTWGGVLRRGMAGDYSWGPAAARYEAVYRRALGSRPPGHDVV